MTLHASRAGYVLCALYPSTGHVIETCDHDDFNPAALLVVC
jgi:hypothetical protein